jgi:hypothetical protein
MSKESDNKAIVGRWFTNFWGKTCNLAVVDQIAAPNSRLAEAHPAQTRSATRDDDEPTRSAGPCYDEESRGGNLMPVGGTNRRTFLAALGGAEAWPFPARAQRAGIVGSLLPAWRAVRLVPTEALRRR